MLTKFKFILVAAALLSLSSCETIWDDTDDCGVWLEFIFDYNMEFADSFDPQVKTVDVYLFDRSGRFVSCEHAGIDDLHGRKRLFLGYGLPFGKYRILTVGNLSDPFRFADRGGNLPISGVTTIEDVLLSLNAGESSRAFGHLFFSPVVEMDFKADLRVLTVPLIRETNRFNIVLRTREEPVEGGVQGVVAPRYTVEIIAPESGAYDYLNNPSDLSELVYRPSSLLSRLDYTESGVLRDTEARINTMRLLADRGNGYRMAVRDIASGEELWSGDLLSLLTATDRPPRPDGTYLPKDEYLDRESEWHIAIIYKDGSQTGEPEEGFVALQVTVNGWIVWKQGMEL